MRFSTISYVFRVLWSESSFRKRPTKSLIRLFSWVINRIRGQGNTIPFKVGQTHLAVYENNKSWQRFVFREKSTEQPELVWLTQWLQPGMVAVDVGAHLGFWTTTMAAVVGESGQVYSFEPARKTYDLLTTTIAHNRLNQVTAIRSVVSSDTTPVALHHHSDSSRNSIGGADGGSSEIVPSTILDGIFSDGSGLKVDALKIDVEGAEELVLRGGTRMLERDLPVVVFEMNPEDAQRLGLEPDGAWNFLSKRGYSMYYLDDSGNMVAHSEPLNPHAAGRVWNVIAFWGAGDAFISI